MLAAVGSYIICRSSFVPGLYSEYGYEKRLTMLEAEFPGANILLHKLGKLPKVLHIFFWVFFVAVLISDLMLYVVSTTVWFWYSTRHWNGSTHDRSDSWYIPLCHHILKQDFFWCLLYTILWCSTVISVWRPSTMDAVRIWCMPWHVWKLLWKLYTDQYWMNAVCAWNLPPETKNKKYRENGI